MAVYVYCISRVVVQNSSYAICSQRCYFTIDDDDQNSRYINKKGDCFDKKLSLNPARDCNADSAYVSANGINL